MNEISNAFPHTADSLGCIVFKCTAGWKNFKHNDWKWIYQKLIHITDNGRHVIWQCFQPALSQFEIFRKLFCMESRLSMFKEMLRWEIKFKCNSQHEEAHLFLFLFQFLENRQQNHVFWLLVDNITDNQSCHILYFLSFFNFSTSLVPYFEPRTTH